MFTKIKAALASFAIWIAKRTKPMDLEAEVAAGVAATEEALKAAAGEAEKVIDKIEGAIEPAKAIVQPVPVFNAVQPASTQEVALASPLYVPGFTTIRSAPAAVSTVDATIAKVKDLIVLADREVPASFDALATLAKSVASDADGWLTKMESLLDYGKAKPDVWAQIVGAVKAL